MRIRKVKKKSKSFGNFFVVNAPVSLHNPINNADGDEETHGDIERFLSNLQTLDSSSSK